MSTSSTRKRQPTLGTAFQRRLLAGIDKLWAAGPFTRADLCREVGVSSPGTLTPHLRILERDGYILWEHGKACGLRPNPNAPAWPESSEAAS